MGIMKQIMTVCGPIDADALGVTSMHDHVLADLGFFCNTPPEGGKLLNCPVGPRMEDLSLIRNGAYGYMAENWNLTDPAYMEREVAFFKEKGGGAILDPSAPGIRSNLTKLKGIAEHTGVAIIASTGLYREETWPEDVDVSDQAQLTKRFLDEINTGIDDTDIKAGHIKTAVANGSEREFNVLPAAAAASIESGLSVTAHTSFDTPQDKREQMLADFLKAGIDPERLIFCHVQYTFLRPEAHAFPQSLDLGTISLDWAQKILDAGATVCVDLFGMPQDNEQLHSFGRADAIKVAGLLKLIKLGYEKQLVVGCDIYQKIQTQGWGGHGYSRILDYLKPALLKYEAGEEAVDNILIYNPRRLLEFS
jgi:phosphotriesterase-related protein